MTAAINSTGAGKRGYPTKSFFFNDTATTEIYTLSLHDALPISRHERRPRRHLDGEPDPDPVRLTFRAGLAGARGRPRVLGQGPRTGRRRPVGRVQGAQVPSDAEHPGAGAAALGGPMEGGPAPRRRGDPAR